MTTRRTFAKVCSAAAATALLPLLPAVAASPSAADEKLGSELLFDLIFERGPATRAGSHVVIGVAGGTFEGPKLRGTVIAPSGDAILVRPDGASVVDLRMLLQTDDGEKIYMTSRGIAYVPKGGGLYARILPMFETSAAKYAWMNTIVGVGVYRPLQEKVAYRVYQIV